MNESTQAQKGQGTGYLVVQVTTATGAIPLSGAEVTVRESTAGGGVLYELRSGRDGRTDRVPLSTPPRESSERPSDTRPYAIYNVEVRLPHYETAFYQNVPVFDGITAIQQTNLIPLPENGYPDGFTKNGGLQFEGADPQPFGG